MFFVNNQTDAHPKANWRSLEMFVKQIPWVYVGVSFTMRIKGANKNYIAPFVFPADSQSKSNWRLLKMSV